MQTSPNIANSNARKTNANSRFSPHVARLATFIEHHHHLGRNSDSGDRNVVEIRRSDAEIAFHLGISMAALEQCFAELIDQSVIRLPNAFQIEILDNARLSEFARQKA